MGPDQRVRPKVWLGDAAVRLCANHHDGRLLGLLLEAGGNEPGNSGVRDPKGCQVDK
jgi:hypothetical protein